MDLKETKVNSQVMYDGHIMKIELDQVRCPDNSLSTREIVRKGPAAVILPILDDGRIILEKQFRYAYDEVILELPAGKIEPGEDPLIGAIRELEEETGYSSSNVEYLGKIYPTVGFCDEVIHMYVARNLIKGEQHLDEQEFVELVYCTLEELKELIKNGAIVDSKTIVAILKYLLLK